jgi:GH15 family glucan-1,4-alpha-glucosidase
VRGSQTMREEYVTEPDYWEFLAAVVEFVIENWRRPDAGLWESRAGYRHFVYSKVMCWVALDRGIKIGQDLLETDESDNYDVSEDRLQHWAKVREEIREDVLISGYDPKYRDDEGAFVQFYGSKNLDASNLKLPMLGFIEPDDPRMRSTIEMSRQDLTSPEGFVYRYSTQDFYDGVTGEEGSFSICTFWLISICQRSRSVKRRDQPRDGRDAWQLPPGILSPGVHRRRGGALPGDGSIAAASGIKRSDCRVM